MDNADRSPEFISYLKKKFHFSLDELRQVIKHFHTEMENGLKDGSGSLRMLPSFAGMPSGKEKGSFLALDLGGTNFRILDLDLDGQGNFRICDHVRLVIPEDCAHGRGSDLFDFIARALKSFLEKNRISPGRDLGFVFSFPVHQTEINKGILVDWTKDFSASGVVGSDVVFLLKEALKRNNVPEVNVVALVNDTVSTLLGEAYASPDVDVGVILGTGTNACYAEKIDNIEKVPGARAYGPDMIINMEWGNFNLLKQNCYDRKLDQSTAYPGTQALEKMVSGMYLGRLVKTILDECVQKKILFSGKDRIAFTHAAFGSEDISLVESDSDSGLLFVRDFLKKNGVMHSKPEDRYFLQAVCRIVSRRAARISAAGIGAVLTRLDPELEFEHIVAVDGSLFQKHPDFGQKLRSALEELFVEKTHKIRIRASSDGSGKGGAVACAVTRARNRK
ncbi:MAG: hypothetical protein ACQES5_10230 [Thermodesulfobacteriota bacterium]